MFTYLFTKAIVMKKFKFLLTLTCIFLVGILYSQPVPSWNFDTPMVDRFWIAMDETFDTVPGMNGGIINNPGEDGRWYFYDAADPWFNIWFWNGDFLPMNSKHVVIGFWAHVWDLGFDGEIQVVVNWDTPDWAWPPPQPPAPPLPPFSPPEQELEFVGRSPVNLFPLPASGEMQWIEFWWEIPDFNPDWISVDVWGQNFIIPMEQPLPPPDSPLFPWISPWWNPAEPGGIIIHECVPPDPADLNYEFGDAPDQSLAYIDGTIGDFPTCIRAIPTDYNDYISHPCPNPLFFGGWVDCEEDGNAGWCPYFNPDKYNEDECGGTFPYPPNPAGIIDEGLMMPGAFTITGAVGSETYAPCGTLTVPLGKVCDIANWGQQIDAWIEAQGTTTGYFHLLIDWNQDGVWANDPATTCGGQMVPELVVLNHPIAGPYSGPLSAIIPPLPPVQIGPKDGYVWARFVLTDDTYGPLPEDWDGHGQFDLGETEDYLLYIAPEPVPLGNWPILMVVALIAIFTVIFLRRKM